MQESKNNLLEEVEAMVADHFTKFISAEYVYHDYQHTRDVVEGVKLIGEGYMLSDQELEDFAGRRLVSRYWICGRGPGARRTGADSGQIISWNQSEYPP